VSERDVVEECRALLARLERNDWRGPTDCQRLGELARELIREVEAARGAAGKGEAS
jgi:hypothetical protein